MELIDGVEALLGAEEAEEFRMQALAVEVAVEMEQVHLKAATTPIFCRR